MFGAAPSTKNKPAKLTALITCGNEIHNIEAVIKSVDFADEILVADSYSSDGTYEKALEMASKVIRRKYEYAASQKNWAIPQASHEWILLVDADERVTPELRKEILSTLKNPPNIRLFKGAHCRYEDKYVHEEINANGAIGNLRHKFEHNTFVTLNDYIEKINRYADYQAKDYEKKTGKLNPYHFVIKPIWRFLKHYIIQSGFRDGVAGLSIAYIQSYAVFMRYVKLWLIRKGMK
jgi:glycosyltransferase involved in cell wall biosynthesis